MKCYLVRHGQAVDAAEWPGADDERPLTDKGYTRMQRAATALAALDLEIEAIVASPLLRARQTAEVIARELRLTDRLARDARLSGRFGREQLAEILAEHDRADAVMLVGHEPGMSTTVAALTGGTVAFKPGSVACIELARPSSAHGILEWFAPAKLLASLRR